VIARSSARHYRWGAGCDGWHLVATDNLSIIEEQMPPGAAEVRHHHQKAQQFFYVLSGVLSIELANEEIDLLPRHGLEIAPATPHRVFNRADVPAEFIVISSPPSHGDRMESSA